MREFIIGCLIGSLLLCPLGCMTTPPDEGSLAPRPALSPLSKPLPATPQPKPEAERKIQPGETLVITVWEHPELSRERVVSPEGFLVLPLFGELKVSGRTTAELEKILAGELTPYIKNPLIWVERKAEPPTQKITVLGAVAKPGNYEFLKEQEIKLLPLLGAAGGYTDSAKLETVRIFRTDPVRPEQRQEMQVNLRNLLSHSPTQDLVLQDKDVVLLEQTSGSKWNAGIQKITPTLQLIAVTLGIIWVGRQLREED